MSRFSFLLVALAALAAIVSAQTQQQLALENIDVDNVLKNEKLVRRYIDCVLEKGRCEKNGNDLKGNNLSYTQLN